jgi:type IV secretory pathway TraG/TraD family ATPase VirD4
MQIRISPRVIYWLILTSLFLFPWLLVSALFCLSLHHRLPWFAAWMWVPVNVITMQNALTVLVMTAFLGYGYYQSTRVDKKIFSVTDLKTMVDVAAWSLVCITLFEIEFLLLPLVWLSRAMLLPRHTLPLGVLAAVMQHYRMIFLPFGLLALFLSIFRTAIQKKRIHVQGNRSETTGQFGSADWATSKEFKALHAYDSKQGIFIGMDDHKKPLYLPLVNKLTLSPPGGGKTTASSIPVLLSHSGPIFVFDIRGELWAVTARYRAETLRRQVVVIDPFGVTQGVDFKKGKSEDLLKTHTFNPFDWIPEDQKARDRILNALAAAFVINDGGVAKHFDENAKILIRGYLDYIMTMPPDERGLMLLYQWMSENCEAANTTFEQMAQQGGRASAAANQISRVGSDERGSILSTSYRQIDWLGDSNLQALFSKSTFDLRAFLKGNMDIFVILPEDQVKEHNRLVRLLIALLMGLIVQAHPSELPQQKILFLLEELAQLGYCPDVEQCIEVLRARGIVVWTVFQTLSQIELFKKPDLFKGVPLKQIFTNDDVKTMAWIQALAGKKTILTKTWSSNRGHSLQKMQAFGGSVSKGEGESIHETGVDLIPLNEIRELPTNEQWVFLQGTKPIRCKKVRYFEHTGFKGRYDPNPLEVR